MRTKKQKKTKDARQARRLVYLELSNTIDAMICTFCKHSCWEGLCGETELSCEHPLSEQLWRILDYGGPEPGDDCWGFRNNVCVHDAADIVGIILRLEQFLLSHGFTQWSWGSNDNDRLVVHGKESIKEGGRHTVQDVGMKGLQGYA